jgi:hypothetical protein
MMVKATLFFAGVFFHFKRAFSKIYPDRILVNEITVEDIENVWKCQDGSSTGNFGDVTIGYLLEAYPTDWFFLGAKRKDCNVISVGAFIPASVIPLETHFVSDYIYWYNNLDSFGFAPNNEVQQYFADIFDSNDPSRYSISHRLLENSDQTELRVGTFLPFRPAYDYNDVVYRCSLEPTNAPSDKPTLSPTTTPSKKPSKKRCKPTKKPISRCAPNKNTKSGKILAGGDEMVNSVQEDLDLETSVTSRL